MKEHRLRPIESSRDDNLSQIKFEKIGQILFPGQFPAFPAFKISQSCMIQKAQTKSYRLMLFLTNLEHSVKSYDRLNMEKN